MNEEKVMSQMMTKIIALEDMNRRLKERNEYLHKLLGEKIPGAKPNLWIVIISRGGERFNAEFNNKEQAEAVYNSELHDNNPAVLYECVAAKTFVPLIDLSLKEIE